MSERHQLRSVTPSNFPKFPRLSKKTEDALQAVADDLLSAVKEAKALKPTERFGIFAHALQDAVSAIDYLDHPPHGLLASSDPLTTFLIEACMVIMVVDDTSMPELVRKLKKLTRNGWPRYDEALGARQQPQLALYALIKLISNTAKAMIRAGNSTRKLSCSEESYRALH